MKEIVLKSGDTVIVDDEDYSLVSGFSWHLRKGRQTNYAQSKIRKGDRYVAVAMHRLIMNALPKTEIDHINRNGLDNRKENLRFCTKRQNQGNRESPRVKKTSPYKGVSFEGNVFRNKPWRASIYIRGKAKNLGLFATQEEAAEAYAVAARQEYGEFFHQGLIKP